VTLGTLGLWLLAAGAVAIVAEGVVAAVWTRRLAVAGQALAAMLERESGAVQADAERLRQSLEETRRLWEPWRRVLRWLRHPLVAAVLASLGRRWAG
jgi:hypothetical protein